MTISTSLCQRCRVLQFNDEEHGTVVENKRDEPEVIFNKFDPEGAMPQCTDDFRPQAILLNYYLLDKLPDLPVLSASSASGCGMCFAMREKILQLEHEEDPKHKSVLIYKLCFRYTIRVAMSLECFSTLSHLAVHFKLVGDQTSDLSCTVSFDVQAEIGDPCRSWLRIQRAPVSHPISDKSRSRLRKMAKRSYKLSKDPHLPTRVIDVGHWLTHSKMRLVVNQGSHKGASRGKYLALSYCWGSEDDAAKQLKTTKASLCENMKEIKMESLPKTVSDAVLVCRAMRVRYLWVDALCIIQDSHTDWERESAKMAEIYMYSYFTLFPFQSTLNSSISGSYYIYHVTGYYDEEYDKSLLESQSEHPDFLEYRDLAHSKQSPFDCDLKESQWNTRGWTLQEALCSPRLLLFGTRMMHMLVVPVRRSQDMSFDEVSQPWGQNRDLDKLSRLIILSPSGWRNMIQGYSARHLSYSRDRLPAISALARYFSSHTDSKYLAGIWSDELETDLLWAPHGLTTLKSFLTPPKEYLAPTWSWVSQSNPVSWPRHYRLKPEFEVASMSTTTGQDRYGQVQSGFISLRAKVFVLPSSTKMYQGWTTNLGDVDFPLELTSAHGEYLAHLRFDWTDYATCEDNHLEVEQEPTQLSMVLISSYVCESDDPTFYDFDGSWRILGLLVLPTETSGSYRRAGIFLCGPRDLQGPNFWEGIDTTTIILV
ncbi:HET-domain-containing protein [Aspergillus eucalypticola CBS 122712]|uniref:HET-domain-containing protein n=1 Tax=Aspergillus eucalypticola (strain CBS 122712 / IBT 29274) TaxID=1448314 RepID=A0A317UKZ9_ASPEC|nr:HET-domain-containing protein [Aspergillus eucalypticola CBS 122712]PWY62351.1 HET-domain-containing protein [Aspergillus eucalypticola CBS 122712]